MEYEQKLAWLRRYLACQKIEEELIFELEQARSQAERVTPLLSGAPGAVGQGQLVPCAVERIAAIESELVDASQNALQVRQEIVSIMDTISDACQREILRRRYLVGQKWDDIAADMHIDVRWATKLHRKCVEDLRLEEAHKSPGKPKQKCDNL